MEGLEKQILCMDDEDYDAFVKILCVCANRKNVIIIVYAVVSNHCHAAVLAVNQTEADAFGEEIKRMYSMWFSRKYGGKGILRKTDVQAISLDTDWYVRNALAYILRNALDNGCNVSEYPWSAFSAMFSKGFPQVSGFRKVSSMTKKERRGIMHTGDKLEGISWLVDDRGHLIPRSICDYNYLEQVFENDQAFFLKTIGGQNAAEMKYKLVDSPRKRLTDNEFVKKAEETSLRWFSCPISEISIERKIRLIPFLFRTNKTTVPQIARTFGLGRDEVLSILGRSGGSTF